MIQTFTLSDFLPEGRVILCPECREEMDTSWRMDGRSILLGLRCPAGHRKDFDWPIGALPPPEALALLGGR